MRGPAVFRGPGAPPLRTLSRLHPPKAAPTPAGLGRVHRTQDAGSEEGAAGGGARGARGAWLGSGVATPGEAPLSFLGILTPLSAQARFCCVFAEFSHLTSSVPAKPSVSHCRGCLDTESPSPAGEAGGGKGSCRRGHWRVFHFVFRPTGKTAPEVYH